MERGEQRYLTYLEILRRELVPAMGCTEPVALAYCAAKARELLGTLPDRVEVEASGNIIKNVKSVIVPNTDGRKGVEAAAAIGVLAGDASRELEALSQVTQEQKEALGPYMERTSFQVTPADSDLVLDIRVRAFQGTRQAEARIVHHHTNVVYLACDGQVLLDKPLDEHPAEGSVDYGLLSVAGICSLRIPWILRMSATYWTGKLPTIPWCRTRACGETTARTSARCCWMPTAGIYGPGPRRSSAGIGRAYEWLRTAGDYQFGQWQSGNDHLLARH